MSQALAGSFNTGSVACGVGSQQSGVPSSRAARQPWLTLSGLDGSNTVKTQRSTNNGATWADQTTWQQRPEPSRRHRGSRPALAHRDHRHAADPLDRLHAVRGVLSMIAADDEQLEALRRQLEGVEDQIGTHALNWRAAAANPATVAREAERLGYLERQRELLRTAIEQAEAEAAEQAQQTIDERRQAYADQAREPVQRECIAYAEMGAQARCHRRSPGRVGQGPAPQGADHPAHVRSPAARPRKVSGLRLRN